MHALTVYQSQLFSSFSPQKHSTLSPPKRDEGEGRENLQVSEAGFKPATPPLSQTIHTKSDLVSLSHPSFHCLAYMCTH